MLRSALTAAAAAGLVAGTGAGMTAAFAGQPADAGPPYSFTTVLHGQFAFTPLKNAAMIRKSDHGLTWYSGQQDGDLTVTKNGKSLRFHDRTADRFEELAGACDEVKVDKGASKKNAIDDYTASKPMLLQIWPRLGHDFTDGSTLPETISMSVLGDDGDDVALLGAGPDFFNGAKGKDRVRGSAGNDWLRTGDHDDRIRGGSGNDYLMGVAGNDWIRGGAGDDRVGGGPGSDNVRGGSGANRVSS